MDWSTLKYGSGEITLTRNGKSGKLIFTIEAANMPNFINWLCRTHYPGAADMWVSQIQYRGIGKNTITGARVDYTHYEVIVEYTTLQRVDSAPMETWEFGAETLETGEGRRWMNAKSITDVSQGIIFPSIIRSITLVCTAVPAIAIMNCIGHVNDTWFQGFPPETLLFEGANTDQQYDYERNIYIYRMTHKLTFRPVSWNVTWRAPMRATDEFGNPATDGETGEPVYVAGIRGKGGWDRLTPPLYGLADFNPLFFLPPRKRRIGKTSLTTTDYSPQQPKIDIPWMKTK